MDDPEANIAKLQEEAYRLSEAALASDTDALDASNERAMQFCAVVIAGAAILAGLFDAKDPNVGILVGARFLTLSAALAGYSAKPRIFYSPGAKFSDFDQDFRRGVPFHQAIEEMARYNDKHSEWNRRVLLKNAQVMMWSYGVAIAGLAIAILSQLGSL